MKQLSILKADQNSLAFIPACIGDCHQLTELMLTENLLTDLPSTLGNLQLLSALNVDKNQLLALPEEVFLLCEESLGLFQVSDFVCRGMRLSLLSASEFRTRLGLVGT